MITVAALVTLLPDTITEMKNDNGEIKMKK